jgi:hypothetical protein
VRSVGPSGRSTGGLGACEAHIHNWDTRMGSQRQGDIVAVFVEGMV